MEAAREVEDGGGDLVLRAAGDQAKTTCGDLQLCTGLEADIEVLTRAMGERQK